MTDTFRALCAELTNELSGYKVANPMHDRSLLNRARELLAEPVAEAPTVEEQALALLQPGEPRLFNNEMQDTIRRALEQLDD